MADTRKRLTDRGYSPKTGSFGKSADPYLMNQERRPGSEPSVTQYESGNPSTWAEDVQPVDTWKQEYDKGRNEVGMGNFLDSTWKEREQIPPSYDKAASEALKQAAAERQAAFESARKLAHKALHLAHAMFPQADEGFIQGQARDFMNMGEASLDATIDRIVGAGEVPPEFKEHEFKKDEGEKKASDEEEEEEAGCKASTDLTALRAELDSIKSASDAGAHTAVIAALEARLAALEKGASEEEEEESKEASVEDRLAALTAGLDSLTRSAGEEEEEEAEEEAEEEEEEAEEEEEEAESKEASLEIELTPPEMEPQAAEGDLLNDIFASAEGKTASKNAPKKGVSKLGGVSKAASEQGLADLSRLWKSDPDVSGDFR